MHEYGFNEDRLRVLGLLTTVAVFAAIAASALWEHVHLGPSWLVGAPSVAAIFAALFALVNRKAWRWQLLRATGAVTTPMVGGTYEGTLRSSYQNVELPIRVTTEQTWTRLIVRLQVLLPQSSESVSMTAALREVGARRVVLTYTYRNTVMPLVAEPDMNDHDGTAEITIDATSPDVSGRYYNYRGRKGSLSLRKMPTR